MGFYGNITNVNKTQFTFDKIYSSRYLMESRISSDSVYLGRYVLVEYDLEFDQTQDTFVTALAAKDSQTSGKSWYILYNDVNMTVPFKLGTTPSSIDPMKAEEANSVLLKQVVKLATSIPENETQAPNYDYYSCVDVDVNGNALFEKILVDISISNTKTPYAYNYALDISRYGNSRGYDSTVWQKVYVNENGKTKEKWVMIAELNSVVPTFDISADAPSIVPITPHFDANSTNVYYKLHWQPQWGLKVKGRTEAESNKTDDKNIYPSDENVKYQYQIYDPITETTSDTITEDYAGAIYYNKAGFEKDYITYAKQAHLNDTTNYYNDNKEVPDVVSILPTGYSGNNYNVHGELRQEQQVDTQEMKVILPSIGNTIAEIWDIIYGNEELNQGRNRNLDISWDSTEGHRLVNENENIEGYTFDKKSVETIAGCINSVHDLMGMIIRTSDDYSTINDWVESENSKQEIYFDGSKFYRVKSTYSFTTYDGAVEESTEQLYVKENNSEYNFPIGSEWNMNVTTIPSGVVLGTRKLTDSPEELEGFARSMNTMHGALLRVLQSLEGNNALDRDITNLQGAINTIDDIIAKFYELIPQQFTIINEYGQIQSADWTTEQKFDWTNIGTVKTGGEASSEDRWIYVNVNDGVDNPLITIEHRFTPVADTTTQANKNKNRDGSDVNTGSGLNKGAGNTLRLYTPIVDSMGHVVGKNTETVALPYGYKFLETNGLVEETRDIYTTIQSGSDTIIETDSKNNAFTNQAEANSVQDNLALNSYNKWIQIKVSDDKVEFAHEIHGIDETIRSTDLNDGTNEISLQDIVFDDAGHIIESHKHTYELPYGYKTFTSNGISSNVIDIDPSGSTQTTASNTQDSIAFDTYNKWIQIEITDDKLEIAHEVHDIETVQKEKTDLNNGTNSIVIQDTKYDEAGHLTHNQAHEYELPYGFKTINTNGVGSNSGNMSTNTTAIVADNTQDTFSIDSYNKWIRIANDSENDRITIAHETHNISTSTPSTNFNNVGSFTTQDLTFDAAGHVESNNTHTYTLPNNFKTITVENTQVIPNTYNDDFKIGANNRWVELIGSDASNSMSIGHADADTTNNTTTTSSTSNPGFGGSFDIPVISYDSKGHISKVTTTIINMPIGSETGYSAPENVDGKVITSVYYNKNTGAFTHYSDDVGNRLLTGYSKGNNGETLVATDSINIALSKLENQVSNEITNRENAINKEVEDRNTAITDAINSLDVNDSAVANQYVSSVSEENGKIKISRETLPDYSNKYDNSNTFTYDTTGTVDDTAAKTIEWLFAKVASLEARIAQLESPAEEENPTV